MGILRIIGSSILCIIVGVIVVSIGWNYFIGQKEAHINYCNDWLGRLNESKASVNILTGDATIAQLNAEVNQYNHECASPS
jgi:hypothetical protein